jgi:predicted patatin/cPLA2 family phospholipase
MDGFISDITKLFMIKNCCYNEKRENIIIKAKKNKWQETKYSNIKVKKICKELEDKMEFKKEINPQTLQRVAID